MELREYLQEYRALTLDAMEKVDENGTIVSVMNQREIILNKITECDYNNEQIKKIAEEIDLFKLENELKEMIVNERTKIKNEMLMLRKKEQANQQYLNYGSMGYIQPRFDKRF